MHSAGRKTSEAQNLSRNESCYVKKDEEAESEKAASFTF